MSQLITSHTIGQIDTATIYGALSAFTFNQPADCFNWAWRNAIEMTAITIGTSNIYIAPVPGVDKPRKDSLGKLLGHLSFLKSPAIQLRHPNEELATRSTKEWVLSTTTINDRFNSLLGEKNYKPWIDWNVRNVWIEHCGALGSLVDSKFIGEVFILSGLSWKDFLSIIEISKDPNRLKMLIKRKHGDIIGLAKKIYVISVLVRGVYYDFLSESLKCQRIHHQVRELSYPGTSKEQSNNYPLTDSEKYLYTLLVASAFREKSTENRLKSWTRNLKKARKLAESSFLDLSQKGNDLASIDTTIANARKIGIDLNPLWVEQVIGLAISSMFGYLSSFVLTPWQSLFAGIAAYPIGKVSIVKKTKNINTTRRNKLEKVATAVPGRIIRTWSGGISAKNPPQL